ncbi:MAG: hypothetical protein KF687_07520 [Cyclobacteriaceae bacterium]|nr:hypothetical protein [Cyclobacteriaceae bacterium]
MVTNSRLNDGKISYQYEDVAVGYSKASYFLGLGGLRKDAMLNDAKRNMYLSYPLKPNQFFDNITLDKKVTYVLPFSKVEMILVADVIELDSGYRMNKGAGYLETLTRSAVKSKGDLSNYEPVLLVENARANGGRVVSINKRNATVFYVNADGLIRVGNKRYSDIYKITNLESVQMKVGVQLGVERNFILMRNDKSSYSLRGKVIGMNRDRLLLETPEGARSIQVNEISTKN